MARAIWKGVIRFGDEAVPVKLYSAVEDRTVHFQLRHEGHPVRQRMVDPLTDDVVERDEIQRGYEVEQGVFVTLDDEELEALRPRKSRDITITRFLRPSAINHQWYDRPYYLGPDGDAEGYFALVDALSAESREGLARWTMRNKAYVGALRARDGHLLLITLRHADEVIPASVLPRPTGREFDPKEIKLARQLVAALEDELDPADYEDEYRARVLELIEAKAAGKVVELGQPARRRAVGDLAASLEASVRAARERKRA